MSNKIENEAIKFVLENCKGAKDVRGKEKFDVKWGKKKIEVKGTGNNRIFQGFVIEGSQKEMFEDTDYWIYRVKTSKPRKIIKIRPSEIKLSKKQIRYNAISWKEKTRSRKFSEYKN